MGDKADGDSEVEYIVEKIIGSRIRRSKVEYLIKWKDYPRNENTWEPETNLNGLSLLEEFKERNLKNNAKKSLAVKYNKIQGQNVVDKLEDKIQLQPKVQELISPSIACNFNPTAGIDALRRSLSDEIGLNILNPCYFHTTSYQYLQYFRKEWFEGMDVLDMGCNEGHLTLTVAREMSPRNVVGVDVDDHMIRAAKETLVQMMKENDSLSACNKDLVKGHDAAADGGVVRAGTEEKRFPFNVLFVQGDYVLASNELLAKQSPSYDTILCLNLTKWVHLKWGDQGLIRFFKRMYLQLKPGGRMILEYQEFKSYRKHRKTNEIIKNNYKNMCLIPELFVPFLLSREIGFTQCEVLNMPTNPSERSRKPIVLFTKGPPLW